MSRIVFIGLLIAAAASSASACTTYVVGRKASATGRVIVGHNEDDSGDLRVRHGYVPARSWGPGELLPCEEGLAQVPQVPETLGFFWTEVRSPSAGLSVADAMFNERGVLVLSNGASGSTNDSPAYASVTDGGVGYLVRRAVAERATSARAAVAVITNLVSTWGYAPASGRLYTVADADEAFVAELVRGRTFVVRRCPDDQVTIIPNCYTIHALEEGDVRSADLIGFTGDFARRFQLPKILRRPKGVKRQSGACRFLMGCEWTGADYPFAVVPSRKIGADDLKELLDRQRFSCTVERSIWSFGDSPTDMTAEIANGPFSSLRTVRFAPLGKLPPEMDDADAAGRLERHFLPEPETGGCDAKLFLDLLRVPSQTDDIPACNRATDVLKAWLTAHGVVCNELTTPTGGRRFLHAATTPGQVHDYLFVTHLDVVPADARLFVPRIEGERVFARGACDTKGNAVVIAAVLAQLVGTGVSAAAVFSTNEESGGGTVNNVSYSRQLGYLPRKLILVGDTSGDNQGLLAVAEKGHVTYRMRAYGRGGHSSVPWLCDNPLPKLMRAYAKVLEAFPCVATQEDSEHDTLVATSVKASPLGNMIADMAEMKLSYRCLKPEGRERMAQRLRELTGLEIEAPTGMPPVTNDPNDPEIAALYEAMRARLGPSVHTGVLNGATDAVRYIGLNVPTVVFTADSHGAHAEDEWGSVSSLNAYADFFVDYLKNREKGEEEKR